MPIIHILSCGDEPNKGKFLLLFVVTRQRRLDHLLFWPPSCHTPATELALALSPK